MTRKIFVFGSNLAGVHGAGSARAALEKHGAEYGVGVGLCGNSYAIPTKDEHIQSIVSGKKRITSGKTGFPETRWGFDYDRSGL